MNKTVTIFLYQRYAVILTLNFNYRLRNIEIRIQHNAVCSLYLIINQEIDARDGRGVAVN